MSVVVRGSVRGCRGKGRAEKCFCMWRGLIGEGWDVKKGGAVNGR